MSRAKAHSFPPFYACYLLKSLNQAYKSKNYIGSTLNPDRRLKQHNGLLPQGARKTTSYRPWEMQLLVYGFPSKPAALTFEWAWQHPHRSRYMRDHLGNPFFSRRGTLLEHNIIILQKMIRTHPFSTWPLHVKLFTQQADYCWKTTASVTLSPSHDSKVTELLFPPGFTCSVELEGVDGSSGILGTGRTKPVSITDEPFTSTHLTKHNALIGSGIPLSCSICKEPMSDYGSNHLETALCTASSCTAVSHLKCLASSFLEQERDAISRAPYMIDVQAMQTETRIPKKLTNSNAFGFIKGMVPRGGNCTHCKTYTLWGDVVKGCYRRHEGGKTLVPEEEEEGEDPLESDNLIKLKKTHKKKVKVLKEESDIIMDTDVGVMLRRFEEMKVGESSLTTLGTSAIPVKKRGRPKKLLLPVVELYPQPRKRGRPKTLALPNVNLNPEEVELSTKKRGRPKSLVSLIVKPDKVQVSSQPKKCGRPKKLASSMVKPQDSQLTPQPKKRGRPKKGPELALSIVKLEEGELSLEPKKRGRPKIIVSPRVKLEEVQPLIPIPKKRGRPRKIITDEFVL